MPKSEFEIAETIAREVRGGSQYYNEQRIAMMTYALLVLGKKPEEIEAMISKAEDADRLSVAFGGRKKPQDDSLGTFHSQFCISAWSPSIKRATTKPKRMRSG